MKRRKELDTSSTENSEESEFSDPDWGAKLPIRKGPVKKRKVIVVQTPGTVDKNGNNLDSRSREYLEQFAMVGKINLETKKKYECEFNKFIEFIGRTETNGDTLVENLEAE